jgi:hypothetical protein
VHPPRGDVRYGIGEDARKATLVEILTDPDVGKGIDAQYQR